MQNLEVYPYQRVREGQESKKKSAEKTFSGFIRKEFRSIYSWNALLLMILSFFMGRALLLGELLPFTSAFFAAVAVSWRSNKFFVFVFSAIGIATVAKGYPLAAAIGTLGALYLIMPLIKVTEQQQGLAIAMEVFTCTVIVKTAFVAYFDPSFYNYVVIFFEALLAGIIGFLSFKGLKVLKDRNKRVSMEEIICLVIIAAGILMGISEIQFKGLALKNIINYFLILTASLMGGSGFGALVGTVVGFIPSITALVAPTIIGVYAFSGVLGGVFRGFGKAGVGLGFLLGLIIFSIYLTDYHNLLTLLGEAALALVLFFAIPARVYEYYKNFFKESYLKLSFQESQEKKVEASARLKEVAKVFNQLGRTFAEISSGVQPQEKDTLQDIFNQITSTTCIDCPNSKKCWETEFYNTYQGILDLFALAEVHGKLVASKVGGSISRRCVRFKEVTTMVNCLYESLQNNNYWEKKLRESRQIVSLQLKGLAQIMEELAVELKTSDSYRVGKKEADYNLTCGVAKAPKSGSGVSGDNYTISQLGNNRIMLALSDGMGVGPNAFKESLATLSILEKLLLTGFDTEMAAKTVNSILFLRSSEETFATLDMALIDLSRGEAEFLKVGAATSFIKSGDHIEVVKGTSLPIGILNNVEVERTSFNFLPGDLLVMATDGLLEACIGEEQEKWMEEALRRIPSNEPQKIANLLLLKAKESSGGLLGDDITIIVARFDAKGKK